MLIGELVELDKSQWWTIAEILGLLELFKSYNSRNYAMIIDVFFNYVDWTKKVAWNILPEFGHNS